MEIGREPSAANPFENESLSQSFHLQQLLGLTPPVTSSITPNMSDLSKSLLSIFNNTSTTSPLLISPKSATNFIPHQTDASKNSLNTSNDDSLDSQSGICDGLGKQLNTRYRRRKPQKTVRMSNDATDSIATTVTTATNTTTTNTTATATTLETEKSNIVKNEHKNDTNNSNGINFSTFHSETNNILPHTNSMVQSPQRQSMDLSHHCSANQEIFENGLVNYNKTNDADLTNTNVPSERESDKNTNLRPSNEMSSINLFGGVSFGHLRSGNLTNDIATFPNTDDLVKKVEELVKCNEQNGFENSDFSPMELTKSHANKLISNTYDINRTANGMADGLKTSNNVENGVNNHSKCNGNAITPTIMLGLDENKVQDNKQNGLAEAKIPNATALPLPLPSPLPVVALPILKSTQNCEIKETTGDLNSEKTCCSQNEAQGTNVSPTSADVNSAVDPMHEKQSNEMKNQANFHAANSSNSHENDATNTVTENEAAKSGLSASSSETPTTNTSPTPKKKTTTRKRVNNRYNGKANRSIGGRSNPSKNAKAIDSKPEKKSDIKKAKPTKDESGSESSSKFRGPYVHVDKDGTLEVINAPLNEEIAEKQSKFKKNYIIQRPFDRNRVRGLHVSTLSTKYDAVTTDISWMCVFCKLGPHKYGLGDLFGPFILSTESEDFQLAHIDPREDVFKTQRNKQLNTLYPHHISAIAAKAMSKSRTTGNVRLCLNRWTVFFSILNVFFLFWFPFTGGS